jgi:hypothetical protein
MMEDKKPLAQAEVQGESRVHFTERFLLPRRNATPRFNSEVRSVSGVTTCTGLPDSRLSQAFKSAGEVATNRPCVDTGIPSAAQRFTTDVGSPKYLAICFQPFSVSDWLFVLVLGLERLGIDH